MKVVPKSMLLINSTSLTLENVLLQHSTSLMGHYPQYTLPRQTQQSQWQYGPVGHLPPGIYPIPYQGSLPTQQRQRPAPREPPIPLQPILQPPEEESSVETPLMINKRESTV